MINVTKTKLPPLDEYNEYLNQIWESGWLTNNGVLVKELEGKLTNYLKVKNLAVTNNATLALQIALKALDLKGEVITTPFTFSATTNVIIWEHLTPVFADVDKNTFNIDPDDIERRITPKTCAILAVHVYGNPCDVERIQEIADKHKLKVIYDAAHAFGVEYKNKSILNYGDISVLSFHATKVFNTIEGGALITKSDKLDNKIRLLRNFGIVEHKDKTILPGINAKMNEFQAAMGLCKIKTVDEEMSIRKMLYEKYVAELKGNRHIQFQQIVTKKYNYSYLPILFKNKAERDKVFNELKEDGINTRKYFYPLTSSYIYTKRYTKKVKEKEYLGNSKEISSRVLCLPLYPDLGLEDLVRVTEKIKKTISFNERVSGWKNRNFWRNKKVIVTGSSGFLGKAFVRILNEFNANLVFPTHDEVDLLNFNDTNNLLKDADVVINCAALDGNAEFKNEHSAQIFDTNLRITSNVLNAAKINKVKDVVLISSSEIYSDEAPNPIKEDDDYRKYNNHVLNGYILSKRNSEILSDLFRKEYGINIYLPRPTNIYGTGDNFGESTNRVIPSFIKRAAAGESIEIWGDGSQVKQFIYEDDVVFSTMTMVENQYSEKLNIATKESISILELAEKIYKYFDNEPNIICDKSKSVGGKSRYLDTTNLQNLIDFTPISLDEGLINTVEWYKKNHQK